MRIISGELKGKTIDFLKSSITRPLKDSVKENIFNILEHSSLISVNLINSSILDLYSGIGSFGLECISRGAKKVTFVEKDSNAINILRKNLTNLYANKKAAIISDKIELFLKNDLSEKFEIIFLDPPFSDNSYLDILKTIKEKKVLKKNHIIIIHRERKTLDNFRDILDPLLIRQYERSKIVFGKF